MMPGADLHPQFQVVPITLRQRDRHIFHRLQKVLVQIHSGAVLRSAKGVAMKQWTAKYGAHNIQLICKDNGTAELYIDSELVDSTNDLYASEAEPALVGMIGDVQVSAFITAETGAIRFEHHEEFRMAG
jgi:hypothetical protein